MYAKAGCEYVTGKQKQAYDDYINGMKYAEIAEKYDVTLSTVKSWHTRHWAQKKYADKDVKSMRINKKGAPVGNQNTVTHGAYRTATWDTLDDEEITYLGNIDKDRENVSFDEIDLYTIRERRILQRIKKIRDNNDDALFVEGTRSRKVEVGQGSEKQVQTEATVDKTSKSNEWNKLEEILTKIQSGKSKYLLGKKQSEEQDNRNKEKLDELRRTLNSVSGGTNSENLLC